MKATKTSVTDFFASTSRVTVFFLKTGFGQGIKEPLQHATGKQDAFSYNIGLLALQLARWLSFVSHGLVTMWYITDVFDV